MIGERHLDRRHVLRGLAVLGAGGLIGAAAVPASASPTARTRYAPADWMSGVDSGTTVDDLTIPGSHNSCAVIGGPFDTAKCQDLSLPELLDNGIRFIDIRCRLIDGGFTIHHGPIYQEKNFTDVLTDCRGFFDANPSETVIMSIQQEYSEAPAEEWAAVFNDRYLRDEGFAAMFYRDNRLPTVGEVRGRVVLIANQDHIGGIPASNTDLLSYQNDWEAPVDEKWELIRSHLDAAETEAPNGTKLFVNYSSTTAGATIPNPRDYAEQLNPKTKSHVDAAQARHPHLGAVVMDFAGSAEPRLVDSLIACNG
ncbi:MAG: phosphatidylinositol-specific phospholipase C [Stackebrandtia sp.]